MSHVASIAIEIKDLDALEAACQRLGLVLNRGQETYKWFGSWVRDYHQDDAAYRNGFKPEDYGKCRHAISIPGDNVAYEIGVVDNPDGEGYRLVYDFYGQRKLVDIVGGQDCSKLVQLYAVEAAKSAAIQEGWSVTENQLDNGEIELQLAQF